MSANPTKDPFIGPIAEMRDTLNNHVTNYYRGRHRIVMIDDVEALTLTLVGTAGVADLDLSPYIVTGGTGKISDDTIACIFKVRVKDTGSATTNISFSMRKKGLTGYQFITNGGHINSQYNNAQGFVGIDSNYTCQFKLTASAANTLSVTVYMVGYIERLT